MKVNNKENIEFNMEVIATTIDTVHTHTHTHTHTGKLYKKINNTIIVFIKHIKRLEIKLVK